MRKKIEKPLRVILERSYGCMASLKAELGLKEKVKRLSCTDEEEPWNEFQAGENGCLRDAQLGG